MANALYDTAREAFASAAINWAGDTIKAQLIDLAAYTPDLVNDQFLSGIAPAARIGAPVALAGKTNVHGVMGAANVSVTGIAAGAPTIEAVVIYKDTGNPATSQLIAYIDDATGLPTAAGATQVDITWDTGANKIARI